MTNLTLRAHGHLAGRLGFKERPWALQGSTVGDLLLELRSSLGVARVGVLFDGERLSDMTYILVNGRNIEQADGLGTKLAEGDMVSILPLMAGG